MGKLLRVLVVVILVLSVFALFFANKLFAKKEILSKRLNVLEEQVVKVAKTIEAQDAADVAAPELQKDISEVSERELANPEKESVLENYAAKLEQQNLPTIDFGSTEKRRHSAITSR
jgi:biopolymer transport protein ExbB/TolQ